jgi:hypothetical protein
MYCGGGTLRRNLLLGVLLWATTWLRGINRSLGLVIVYRMPGLDIHRSFTIPLGSMPNVLPHEADLDMFSGELYYLS